MDDDGLTIGGTKGSAATRNWRRSIRSQPRGLNKVLGYELDDSECWVLRDEAMKLRDLPMVAARAGKEGERGTHLVIAAALDPTVVDINIEFPTPPMKACQLTQICAASCITLCSRRQACSREGMELACKCLSSGMWRSGGEMGAVLVVTHRDVHDALFSEVKFAGHLCGRLRLGSDPIPFLHVNSRRSPEAPQKTRKPHQGSESRAMEIRAKY
ncbi:hypothetical protein V8E53_014196 [Lactarius tabidus]